MSDQNPAVPPVPPVPPEPVVVAPPAPSAPAAPPLPQYGEYAPAGTVPQYSVPQYSVPTAGAGAAPESPSRPRRTWDVVLTVILLVLGLFGAGFGVLYGWIFSVPELLNQALETQGRGGFHGEVGSSGLLLVLSHVVLYLAAAVISILLLVKRRIAFWVPLAAGVIAAIIFWVTVFTVLASDPELMSRLSGGQL